MNDFYRMKEEFTDIFDDFLIGMDGMFKRIQSRKKDAVNQCRKYFK